MGRGLPTPSFPSGRGGAPSRGPAAARQRAQRPGAPRIGVPAAPPRLCAPQGKSWDGNTSGLRWDGDPRMAEGVLGTNAGCVSAGSWGAPRGTALANSLGMLGA